MFTQHRGQTRAQRDILPQENKPSDHPSYTMREIDEHEGDPASNDAFDPQEAELQLARTRRKILNLQAKAYELTHQPPAPKETTPDTEATHAARIETLQRQLAAAIRKRDRQEAQAEHDERLAGKAENSANKVRELEKRLQQLNEPQQPAPRARKSVTPPSAKLSRLERLQCDLVAAEAAVQSANQALAHAQQKGKFGTFLQRYQDRADHAAETVLNLNNAITQESARAEKIEARRSRGPIGLNDALPAPRTPLQRIEDRLQALIPKRTALIQKLEAHAEEPEFAKQAAAEAAAEKERLAAKAARRKTAKESAAAPANPLPPEPAEEATQPPAEPKQHKPAFMTAKPHSSIQVQAAEVEPLVKHVLDIINPTSPTRTAPPAKRPQPPKDEALEDEDQQKAWAEWLREYPGKNPTRDI